MFRRRFWFTLLGILALAAVAIGIAAWPGRSTFTVSPETTYVTGPLDKHGYVDYVTALNERLRNGITPERNANVLIWLALGPRPEGSTMPPEYFQWLGIEAPPEQGTYFASWQNYLKQHLKIGENMDSAKSWDPMDRARNWPWAAKDEPEVAGWLQQNEKALAVVMEATQRPNFYNPLVPERTEEWSPGLPASMLPNVQRCRELAAALSCRAMLRIKDGKVDQAWDDLLACHRLGRLVARGGTLVEMLVGLAIDLNACKADVIFLDRAKPTSAKVSDCSEDLVKLAPMPSVADKVDLTERFVMLDMIVLVGRRGTSFLEGLGTNMRPTNGDESKVKLFDRSINWDPGYRNANRWYDRYVAALRNEDRSVRAQELAKTFRDLTALKNQVADIGAVEKLLMGSEARGEFIGNVLIALMCPAFTKVQDAADRWEQEERNLQLAFVLAEFRHDHGRYPAKLDELIPKYLRKIPVDLFSDNPPIYRLEKNGYLLYSVGVNGIDDEGRGYDDEPRGDDSAVRMPVPKPRGDK